MKLSHSLGLSAFGLCAGLAIASGGFTNDTAKIISMLGVGALPASGADADLIFDDLLIDVKTTKNLALDRKHFDQLLGYYTLSVIERRFDPDIEEIRRLGIYFSRYAYLYEFPVVQVINPQTFPQFVKWFEKRAQEI